MGGLICKIFRFLCGILYCCKSTERSSMPCKSEARTHYSEMMVKTTYFPNSCWLPGPKKAHRHINMASLVAHVRPDPTQHNLDLGGLPAQSPCKERHAKAMQTLHIILHSPHAFLLHLRIHWPAINRPGMSFTPNILE